MIVPRRTKRYAFESFSFDAATGELRLGGRSTKLRPQMVLVLDMLLARQGQVVTRDELRKMLWPDERIVMFEASIAAVVRELRRALGDTAKSPRFIETIPKRGYRFLPQTDARVPPAAAGNAGGGMERRQLSGSLVRAAAGLVMLVALGLAGDTARRPLSSPVIVEVMPFDDLTRLSKQRIVAASVSRDVVGWLGPAVPTRVRVVDRTAAAGEVERKSNDGRRSGFVVRGSVRDEVGAVVISARLLSAADGAFIWGEDFRRIADDAGLAAREVAARIADNVLSGVLPQREESGHATSSERASMAFSRGLGALAQSSREGTIEAVAAFKEATAIDAGFAAAHARLAEALVAWTGPTLTIERVEQARQAARRSIDLDAANPIGHRVLGEIALYFDRHWQLAERYLKRGVELSPANATGHHSYAAWLSARGLHDEALREIDLARTLDPGSIAISFDVMLLHFYARQFAETVAAAKRLETLFPGNEASHRYIVLSRLATGDVAAAAIAARARLAGVTPTAAVARSVSGLSDLEALRQYWMGSIREVSRQVQEHSGDRAVLASLYIQLGEFDKAISELEVAIASRRFSYFVPFLGVSPAFDELCGHPQFERTLRALDQSALSRGEALVRCAAAIREEGESETGDRKPGAARAISASGRNIGEQG